MDIYTRVTEMATNSATIFIRELFTRTYISEVAPTDTKMVDVNPRSIEGAAFTSATLVTGRGTG